MDVIPAELAISFSLRLISLRLKREPESRNFRTVWILASAGMTTKAFFDKVQIV